MQFNDTTNNSGIIQACERYTGLGDTKISGNTDRLKEFTQYINTSLRNVWHYIFLSTGSWEYDDSNYTDLPQATTALISGQAKYAIPSDALTIKRVEIKDDSDNWIVLKPLIREEIKEAVDELFDTDSTPMYYRVLGDSIELFPASDYNQNASLKVYFDRKAVSFVYTDTTKTLGIASSYEDIVPIYASLEWLKINLAGDPRTAQLKEDYSVAVKNMRDYYNRRFPAKKKVLRPAYNSYK